MGVVISREHTLVLDICTPDITFLLFTCQQLITDFFSGMREAKSFSSAKTKNATKLAKISF